MLNKYIYHQINIKYILCISLELKEVTDCKNARCGKLQNVTTYFVVLNADLQIRCIESETSVHRGATSYCDK